MTPQSGNPKGLAERVIGAAARIWDVPARAIRGERRERKIAVPRMAAMLVLHEAGLSLGCIGRLVHRDHSSVAHGVRRIATRMAADPLLAHRVQRLRAIAAGGELPDLQNSDAPGDACPTAGSPRGNRREQVKGPPGTLTNSQCQQAQRLKARGWSVKSIARYLDVAEILIAQMFGIEGIWSPVAPGGRLPAGESTGTQQDLAEPVFGGDQRLRFAEPAAGHVEANIHDLVIADMRARGQHARGRTMQPGDGDGLLDAYLGTLDLAVSLRRALLARDRRLACGQPAADRVGCGDDASENSNQRGPVAPYNGARTHALD